MTPEKNESPSEPPVEMPVQKEGKNHGCFRGYLIAFFAAALVLFILFLLPPFGRVSPKALALDCRSSLEFVVYRNMLYYLSLLEKEGREFPPDWTVPAMVQEMYGTYAWDWRSLFCPVNAHRDPYLAFSAPVSVLLNPAEQKPVPILMCPPGAHAHGDKRGSMVLYSDGTVKSLTTEEAEKLVAEHSPVPLKLQKTEDQTVQE